MAGNSNNLKKHTEGKNLKKDTPPGGTLSPAEEYARIKQIMPEPPSVPAPAVKIVPDKKPVKRTRLSFRSGTIQETKRSLNRVNNLVLNGKLDDQIGRTIGYLASVILTAFKIEAQEKENELTEAYLEVAAEIDSKVL
jgi:hypothetical protein